MLVSAGAVDSFIYHCFPHFPTCTAYEICKGIGENLNTGYLSSFLNNMAHSFKLLCVTSGVQCLLITGANEHCKWAKKLTLRGRPRTNIIRLDKQPVKRKFS